MTIATPVLHVINVSTPVLHEMTVATPVLHTYDDHLNPSTSTTRDDRLNPSDNHLDHSNIRDDHLNPSTTCDDCLNPSTTYDDRLNPSITCDIYTLHCGDSSAESIYSLSTNPEATINVTPGLTPSNDAHVTSPRNIFIISIYPSYFQCY